MNINQLWTSSNQTEWENLLTIYWSRVEENRMAIEKELNDLQVETIANMNSQEWYDFLYNKYFFWKYTTPNRIITTRYHLKKYILNEKLDELDLVRKGILTLDLDEIKDALTLVCQIKGLGIAGASGLLALLYPHKFATVDQFVVYALGEVESKKNLVEKMNPEGLTLPNGVVLIQIIKDKAFELNMANTTDFWTPRKVDMALWSYRN